MKKSCYLYQYSCTAPKKSWEHIFWITSVIPLSNLANKKLAKTMSAAELMKLSFLWICYIPPQYCWNQLTTTLLHLGFTLYPSLTVFSGFPMSTHPSKIVMSLKNWQWMIPYRHSSLTVVTYSLWWSHLFLFSIWQPTVPSFQWHLRLPQNLYFSIALRQARNSLCSHWFKTFHTTRGQLAFVLLGQNKRTMAKRSQLYLEGALIKPLENFHQTSWNA